LAGGRVVLNCNSQEGGDKMNTNGKKPSHRDRAAPDGDALISVNRPKSQLAEANRQAAIRAAFSEDSNKNETVAAVVAGLRRRWFLILFLGLLLGCGAAAAVWNIIPTSYTAFTELRIDHGRGDTPWNNHKASQADVSSYRQATVQRVRETFTINRALRDPGVANCPTLRPQEYKDLWLQEKLEVRPTGSGNIRIALSGDRPTDLAKIVQAVTDAFLVGEVEFYESDLRTRLVQIKDVQQKESSHREELKSRLALLNRQIQSSSQAENQLKIQLQNEVFVQLRKEFGDVRLQMIQKSAQLAALEGDDPEKLVAQADIPSEIVDAELAKDELFQGLVGALSRQESLTLSYQKRTQPLQAARVAAEERLQALTEEVNSIRDARRPEIRKRLLESLPKTASTPSTKEQLIAELERLKIYEQQYRQQLDENKSESSQIGLRMIEQQDLMNELADVELRVKSLDDQVWRRSLELENGKAPVQLYLKAEIPRLPDEGKRVKMSAAAGAGGFGLVAALILWLEVLTRRISTPEDVEQRLKLRVVGSIPLMPRAMTRSATPASSSKTAYWQSVLTESIDSARTMLLRLAKVDGVKTVMIASAMGGEGKTTLACHLATSLARGGRKVLLMDCDVREPSVHQVFDFPNRLGFCEVLNGTASFAEALVESSQPGLSILPAGLLDHITLQRLALDQFGELLTEISNDYDFVIVDSAPVLPVTDSLMLAPHVDGIIMSVRRDVSRLTKVAAAVQRLLMLGSPVLGVVTIGLEGAEQSYYYSKYHSRRDRRRDRRRDSPAEVLEAAEV
jgi:capsular exopolysaccharide synthesis family protein